MIYLDNSATTRPYDSVISAVSHFMEEEYGNPSSLHRMGLQSEKAVKTARHQIAGGLNCPDNQIVFTTTRYREHPLVIRGPGAGPLVTAAGVLNDLLALARR